MDESSPRTSSGSPRSEPFSNNGGEIAELVDQMVDSLRSPDIDLAVFVAGAEKMFALFPIEACREVADPGRGYPATERFAPTLAELRIALEEAARPHRLKREREAREQALAQRKEQAKQQAPQGPRPTYADLQRRCAALGLVIGGKRRARAFDADAESERVRLQYGISQAAWDALPRAEA